MRWFMLGVAIRREGVLKVETIVYPTPTFPNLEGIKRSCKNKYKTDNIAIISVYEFRSEKDYLDCIHKDDLSAMSA